MSPHTPKWKRRQITPAPLHECVRKCSLVSCYNRWLWRLTITRRKAHNQWGKESGDVARQLQVLELYKGRPGEQLYSAAAPQARGQSCVESWSLLVVGCLAVTLSQTLFLFKQSSNFDLCHLFSDVFGWPKNPHLRTFVLTKEPSTEGSFWIVEQIIASVFKSGD